MSEEKYHVVQCLNCGAWWETKISKEIDLPDIILASCPLCSEVVLKK